MQVLRVLLLCVPAVLFGSCASATRADIDSLNARLDKIEARLPAEQYAPTLVAFPLVIAKPQQNASTVPLGARVPLCIRFRVADTSQEICHDTYVVADSKMGEPGMAAIAAESKRKADCYATAKVGDRLPSCWQPN
ncbi:MAG: hypothetical protein WC211_07995 [Dehalococcoidia bacterium]